MTEKMAVFREINERICNMLRIVNGIKVDTLIAFPISWDKEAVVSSLSKLLLEYGLHSHSVEVVLAEYVNNHEGRTTFLVEGKEDTLSDTAVWIGDYDTDTFSKQLCEQLVFWGFTYGVNLKQGTTAVTVRDDKGKVVCVVLDTDTLSRVHKLLLPIINELQQELLVVDSEDVVKWEGNSKYVCLTDNSLVPFDYLFTSHFKVEQLRIMLMERLSSLGYTFKDRGTLYPSVMFESLGPLKFNIVATDGLDSYNLTKTVLMQVLVAAKLPLEVTAVPVVDGFVMDYSLHLTLAIGDRTDILPSYAYITETMDEGQVRDIVKRRLREAGMEGTRRPGMSFSQTQ